MAQNINFNQIVKSFTKSGLFAIIMQYNKLSGEAIVIAESDGLLKPYSNRLFASLVEDFLFGQSDESLNQYRERCQITQLDNDIFMLVSRSIETNLSGFYTNLDSFLANLPAIIYTCEPNENFQTTYISSNVKRILGYDADNFLNRTDFWDSITDRRDISLVHQSLKRVIEHGYFESNYRIRNSFGEYRWYRECANLIYDKEGKPIEIVGYLTDVDEQVKLQSQLDLALNEQRTVFESIPGIVFIYDKEMSILDCSKQALALFGLKDKSEIIGKKCCDLFDFTKINTENCPIKNVLSADSISKTIVVEEQKLFGKSFQIISSAITNSTGEILGGVEIFFDITELKKYQEELKDLISTLKISNKLSMESNAKIKKLNSELINSQKELKELNSQKDKLFSIIAHDLRGPLQGFMELTKIITSEFDNLTSAEIYDLAKSMNDTSQNIYRLLNNLLEWSRIHRGKIANNPSILSLGTIIKMNIDLYAANYKSKELNVYNFVNENIHVFADVNILNTIIRNILSNSIKFTQRHGSISFDASIKDTFALITVEDTGIGMTSQQIEKIFTLDGHFTSKGTENETGSGLGLVLVNELVTIIGGKLIIESEVGKGTKLSFEVPLAT